MGRLGAGRRESRRFIGDHILSERDLVEHRHFPDAVAFGGWSLDEHCPGGIENPDDPPSFFHHKFSKVYEIPFRSLYSKNIANLLFAGRNVSQTHIALSSTRVMATCAVMGQAAGTGAAMCVRQGITPRQLAHDRIEQLQEQLLRDDAFIPNRPARDPKDLARQSGVIFAHPTRSGDARLLVDGVSRDENDAVHHWQSDSLPAEVQLEWEQPVSLSRLEIKCDTNLKCNIMMRKTSPKSHHTREVPPELLKSLTAEARVNGQWVEVGSIDNNRTRLIRLDFTKVTDNGHPAAPEGNVRPSHSQVVRSPLLRGLAMRTLIFAACAVCTLNYAFGQEHGIINTSRSPHVKLRSIDIGDCRWTEGFWADKFKLCEQVMVPHMGTLLKGDVGHAYNNFKIVAGLKEGEHHGTNWHDGDFYKWMEAATYVYAINQDPAIIAELDAIIGVIGQAQAEDGYLHTAVMLKGLGRYTNRQHHEMYNSGHLLTAACIHHRVTGKRNFLDIAVKHADHLVRTFGPQPKELARFGFNQTQITGLVELYRTTRNKEYLRLAEIFINMRGRSKPEPDDTAWYKMVGDMVQERVPLRKETEAVGHAVLALYYYAGAADVYAETGERPLIDALDRIWANIVDKKMYVTGACGQTHHGSSSRVDFVHEAFISEYMMPNLTAYNETCANICNAMFNYRMLGIHGESKYADVMELVLYNSALSGISEDGKHYFYTNPLRRTHDHAMDTTDQKTREPYIHCFCCPPNLVRTIAKALRLGLQPVRKRRGRESLRRKRSRYATDGRIANSVEPENPIPLGRKRDHHDPGLQRRTVRIAVANPRMGRRGYDPGQRPRCGCRGYSRRRMRACSGVGRRATWLQSTFPWRSSCWKAIRGSKKFAIKWPSNAARSSTASRRPTCPKARTS